MTHFKRFIVYTRNLDKLTPTIPYSKNVHDINIKHLFNIKYHKNNYENINYR